MKVEIKNKKLFIEIDIDENPKPSASGKSIVQASTHGNQTTSVLVNGKPLIVAVNAYISNK